MVTLEVNQGHTIGKELKIMLELEPFRLNIVRSDRLRSGSFREVTYIAK